MLNDFVQIIPNEYQHDLTHQDQVISQLRSQGVTVSGRYYIDDLRIARSFGQQLDALLADWVDVALFAYLADRLSPRRRRTSQHYGLQWGRRLNLKLPVRRPEIWNRSEVYGSLQQLLGFFTEDDWQIEFVRQREVPRLSESDYSLPLVWPPAPVRVALYSGGLDSFAGTVQQMRECPECQFVLVSGVTNTRQGEAQRNQIRAISQISSRPPIHIPVHYGLRQGVEREEKSQRSRGFLFMTLGAVTAMTAGANELYIYENGIGAINLPYNGSQVGTSSTRAVNPIALLRMSKFIAELTKTSFQIENPFVFQTKAEMCRHAQVRRLADSIQFTFSCDSFPIRRKRQPQCGTCTSCLLRRLSLESAHLSEGGFGYLHDLLAKRSDFGRKELNSLRVMDWQAQRLDAALASSNPWQALKREFPALVGVVPEVCRLKGAKPEDIQSALLRLYSQYVNEWSSFSARKSLAGVL